MPNRPLMKLPAAARYLGITERQLRRICERRVLAYKDFEGTKMFDPDDLDSYLNLIRVEPTVAES